ncbi:MAG: arabinofuranosidase catalytic domain-containing protein [Thermoguttaceae bacterium]|jgi:hypothetical protein|nr:arabinofuranosidase catalytic domain-containing protein [Thermoguttaceae bacterium]
MRISQLVFLPAAGVLVALTAVPVPAGILNVVPGAHAAYSLRRLDDDYAGYAVQVRRDSDHTTQDIGFDGNGQLDTAALLGFVGAGNGYVTTWYDQAGSRNLSQATVGLQPQIVADGSLLLGPINALPALQFSSSTLAYAGTGIGSETMSVLAAASWFPWTNPPPAQQTHVWRRLWTMRVGNASKAAFGGQEDNIGKFAVAWATASGVTSTATDKSIEGNKPFVASYIYDATQADGADTVHMYLDGELGWSRTNLTLADIAGVDYFDVGSLQGTTRFFDGFIQELILYHSVLPGTDRALVEGNMMSLYIPEPAGVLALLCAALFCLGCHRPRPRR